MYIVKAKIPKSCLECNFWAGIKGCLNDPSIEFNVNTRPLKCPILPIRTNETEEETKPAEGHESYCYASEFCMNYGAGCANCTHNSHYKAPSF